jgi:multiple sugar transport system ATP-binding protein
VARIRLNGLTKSYDGHMVLAPLELTIADGEFFTFLGPSGCGKSTLLHLLAGIEPPTRGRIFFGEERVDGQDASRRDVAMVFQSYALYPHLSVRQNLAFPLRARRLAPAHIEREVERVARSLGIEGLLDRKPLQLSGGQRQRVALGRALVRRPRVFLMDEPLSNLDARLRLETREELKRLHDEHRITTVYVTHDQEEAMALSDRIAVLNAGHIQQCDAPQAIYEDPANLFVAQFIGNPPINVLDGDALRDAPVFGRLLSGVVESGALLGLRPPEILVHARPIRDAMECEVVITEPTGNDLWVVGRYGNQKVKGRAAPGERFAYKQTAWFEVRRERVLVFDKRSGTRIHGVA